MSKAETIELFRKALMREHHHNWSMEPISEAAHICAKALYPNELARPLKNDTPEKARKRYREGGFGVYGSPSAKKTYDNYMKLYKETVDE